MATSPLTTDSAGLLNATGRKSIIWLLAAAITSILSGMLYLGHASAVLTFVVSGVALAALASLVGDGTEQLGARMGTGKTGVLQSTVGNLPELFISIFALRAGLVTVVQAALVGSVLGNSLLVLGVAFAVGGFRHGTQRFPTETPRLIALLTLVSVAAVTVPTLTSQFHTAAARHEEQLSVVVAVVLLLIYVASLRFILQGGPIAVTTPEEVEAPGALWPTWLAISVLVGAGVGAAFVSDWFVGALKPAIHSLGISQGFTGLVIVAIAGNAVENAVAVRFSAKNRADLAVSVILNSSLQVAVALIPALVLLSLVVGGSHLTLVLPPLLVVSLALTGIVGALAVYDGESTWIQGLALVGLYVILAAAFWWG